MIDQRFDSIPNSGHKVVINFADSRPFGEIRVCCFVREDRCKLSDYNRVLLQSHSSSVETTLCNVHLFKIQKSRNVSFFLRELISPVKIMSGIPLQSCKAII